MMMSEGTVFRVKLLGRLYTVTAFNAMNFAPLQGEWKGEQDTEFYFPGRRGQIATWNACNSIEGNYNIAVTPHQEKGKSVLAQEKYCVAGLSMGDFSSGH